MDKELVKSGVRMGNNINLRLISRREMWRLVFLPVVADVCCSHDYWTVRELMNDHFGSANAEHRKEVVDILVSISESWNRGRLVEGGEIVLKDEFSDVPRVQPVSDEQRKMESRLPMNEKQVEWLQRWAAEPQPVEEAPTNVICCKDHFLMRWADEDLKDLFKMLKGRRYIAQETTFEQWRYVCTGRGGNEPHEPVMWIKSQSELECLISHIKDDTGEQGYWKKAGGAFLLSDTGRHPNPDSMKNHFMKVRIEQPKNWQGIDAIFLECS